MEKNKCHICGKMFIKQDEIHTLKVSVMIGKVYISIHESLPMDVTIEESRNVHKRCGELRQASILKIFTMEE